ncbi:diguanylate cyclase (GGDEF) domain-containing protein [Kaistia soli DSM 19436]|uniref:diguanylate cyclase n=1 Tax=Kaistia soli DSM 19436 TaxID=1122133 RepID=A0A1M4YU03_9HYPH|nr:sensor domain-containing diguanylate cyclase [Kaistia soli]SHF09261.1 diguanylate cyclase (GGDEF) domain-containing protein [Kaistia soli DSM 19436]
MPDVSVPSRFKSSSIGLRRKLSGTGLVAASVIAAMLVLLAIAVSLRQYREEVGARGLLTAQALDASVEAQLHRQLESYDAALQLVIANFSDPTLRMMNDDIWQLLLSNIQNSAPSILSITIANAGGRVLSRQGAAIAEDFANLPFFKAQQARAGLGLLISDLAIGQQSSRETVILSRRIVRSDGRFGGVVAAVVDLAVVHRILQPMPLGPQDLITVVSESGRVISRMPAIDGGDAGMDVSKSPNFLRMQRLGQGSFTSLSSLDGVERLFRFSRVEGTDMLVVVGLGTEALYSNWRRQSALIGGLALVVSVALVLAALLLAREARLRTAAQDELEKQAMTDFLTGLPNRRQFEMSLDREWRRAARTGADLAVILFDADHFKQLNDRHGHAVGDEMLKLIAEVLVSATHRPGDLPARIGGEEFAIILADTSEEGALCVAERIRSTLGEKTLSVHGGIPAVTLSAGIAATVGRSTGSAAELLAAADAALYVAKEEGRDRIRVRSVPETNAPA